MASQGWSGRNCSFCHTPRHQYLWRSVSMVVAGLARIHDSLVLEYHQISSVALVSTDDARTSIDRTGLNGQDRRQKDLAADRDHLGPRADVLLHSSVVRRPWSRSSTRLSRGKRCQLPLQGNTRNGSDRSARSRLPALGSLGCVDFGSCPSLRALPLVGKSKAAE